MNVAHAGRRDGDAASGEYLERGLGLLQLVGDGRVQLRLVAGSVFVSLRELRDADGEGQSARTQHVDDAVVAHASVEAQLLQDAGVAASGDLAKVQRKEFLYGIWDKVKGLFALPWPGPHCSPRCK